MPLESVKTPCVGFCEVAKWWGICYGCGRRIEEISAWGYLSDTERDRIMEECEQRLTYLYKDDGK